jgi:adenylate cyclase
LEEAIEEVETALAIDPTSPIFSRDLAMLYFFKRDLETALDLALQTAEQDPYFGGAYWIMGLIHEHSGAFDKAIACLEKADQLTPVNPRVMSATGRALALSGKTEAAIKMLASLDELSRQRYVSPLEPALVLFGLDQADRAFERLSHSLQYPSFGLMHLRVDPRFDGLRDDPRFSQFLGRTYAT